MPNLAALIDEEKYLTVRELAALLRVSEWYARKLIVTELEHHRIGRMLVVERAEVDKYITAQIVPVRAPTP